MPTLYSEISKATTSRIENGEKNKKKKEEGRMKNEESTKRKERRSRKTERTVSNNTVNTVMTSADCTENHRDCALMESGNL